MLYIMLQYFTKEGDGVLVFTPVWYKYQQLTEFLGRKFVGCPLYSSRNKQQYRYDINLTDFESKAKNCKALILCNPHNPTGRCWSKQ
jgi:cysteine-S-conjugate beta-lyase